MAQPDRDQDWKPRSDAMAQERVRRAAPDLRALQRAALSADFVTGDEHWDSMLQVVQAKLDGLQQEFDRAEGLLKNSDDFTTSVMIDQKLAVRLIGRQIEALKWVIELPAILMENGDRAKKLLETIDESPD